MALLWWYRPRPELLAMALLRWYRPRPELLAMALLRWYRPRPELLAMALLRCRHRRLPGWLWRPARVSALLVAGCVAG